MPINTDPLAATHPGSDEAAAIAAFAQAAKDGVEGDALATALNSIPINATTFGDSMDYMLVCTSSLAVAVTLAEDVPVKKTLHVLQKGAGAVTVDDNGSTSTLLTDVSGFALAAQYDSAVFRSLGSGEWVRFRGS